MESKQRHSAAVAAVGVARLEATATKQAWEAAKTATSAADTEFRQAMTESVQARVKLAEQVAAEAAKPSPLTHPPVAPGEREVIPPTKVGGIPDWPWQGGAS